MIDQVIGNYKIVEKIGEGGMGAVYRGIDLMLEREVAIKAMRPELTNVPQIVERFRSEAVTLAKLNHPNVATLYSFFRQGEEYYMVLEFVRGRTLDTLIGPKRAMPRERAIQLFCQALEGIDHAHRYGIIHRDIKPGNMMLTDAGTLKVLDFGIARVLGNARLTHTGHLVGTVGYMSPEQVRGRETDARSDIYSLGLLLYEMLTGRGPFVSDSEFDVMRSQVEETPTSPRSFAADLPEAVESSILRALEKKPEKRFQTAGEFRAALLGIDAPQSLHHAAAGGQNTLPLPHDMPGADEDSKETRISDRHILEEDLRETRISDHFKLARAASPASGSSTGERVGSAESDTLINAPPSLETLINEPPSLETVIDEPPPSDALPRQSDALINTPPRSDAAEAFVGAPPLAPPHPAARPASARSPSKLLLPLIGAAVILFALAGGAAVWWLWPAGTRPAAEALVSPPTAGGDAQATVPATETAAPAPSAVPAPAAAPAPPPGMVYVPGGEFRLGRDDGDEYERPAHAVTIEPFFIDAYEVTNEDYEKFVREHGHPAPPGWKDGTYPKGEARRPVTGVTWDDASAYAAWAGKRLPTEQEWEFAARGKDDLIYPWGNEWQPGMANAENVNKGVRDAGEYKGVSLFGAYDMIGNAWEWTASDMAPYPGGSLPKTLNTGKVIRGGCYSSTNISSTARRGWPAQGASSYANTGFRCAQDLASRR